MSSMVQHLCVPVPLAALLQHAQACWAGWPTSRHLACKLAAAAFLTALITATIRFKLEVVIVEGRSMEPTLHEGQYLVIHKHSYGWRRPLVRGDMVVFQDARVPERSYIKRVIGLPGENVEMKAGHVYINTQPLREIYIGTPSRQSWGPATVPMGQCFVLGDNRGASYDSSAWGWLSVNEIIGKVWRSG